MLALLASLSSCEAPGSYTIEYPHKADLAVEPTPKYEPRTIAGNKNPYTVFNKTYRLLSTAFGYNEVGTASWYGPNFHGLKTSNTEVFDMYEISAAHKTLPIPSYVKVTHIENGRSLIVRINDRGPFVGDRLIDLSYAAAKRLGFVDQGKAKVRIEGIEFHPDGSLMLPVKPQPVPTAVVSDEGTSIEAQSNMSSGTVKNAYLQLGRFENEASARKFAKEAYSKIQQSIIIHRGATTFLVALGPLANDIDINQLKQQLQQKGYENSFTIRELN